jgi:PAS domain S-box-containing protein
MQVTLVSVVFTTLISMGLIARSSDEITFEHLGVRHGLSQKSVYCILQDHVGFMWFGTQHGLNRYDGHNFKVFDYDPKNSYSLSHNLVLSICEDSKAEVLWVGTWRGGLNKFDRKTEKFVTFKNIPGDPTSLSDDKVNTIFLDKTGSLWIGTGKGVNRMVREEGKFKRYSHKELTGTEINAIYQDEISGLLLAGSDKGIFRYDRESDTIVPFTCESNPDNSLLLRINTIYADQEEILWIGTNEGLFKFKRDKGMYYHSQLDDPLTILKGKQVKSIYKDGSNRFWIGTGVDGLYCFVPKAEKPLKHFGPIPENPYSLSHTDVTKIYEDNSGLLWFGTNGGGLNKFDPSRKKFGLYREYPNDSNSLNNNDVLTIRPDKAGNIWIGTNGGGLTRFKPGTATFNHFKNTSIPKDSRKNEVRAVCPDDVTGLIWVGTQGAGLYTFDPLKEEFKPYVTKHIKANDYILNIYKDNSGDLWIGSDGGGLTRIQTDRKTCENFSKTPGEYYCLSNNQVFSIFEDSKGFLWVGTGTGGLNKFDRETRKFFYFQPSQYDNKSISHNFITAIYEDKKGTLWIGTNGGGLNKFEPETETFKVYTRKDGLSNNVVYDILEDNKGNLWLSTNKGLSKFNPITETFRNYTDRDGLQDYEFNRGAACKFKGDKMYFGGVKGFNVFDPEKVKKTSSPPPIVITSFKKFGETTELGKPVAYVDEIELSYGDSFISFEFAALSFANPQENQYKYKLDPVYSSWIPLGNTHEIALPNLEPGEYTFQVKGSNSDGTWNDEGVSINIEVQPPWWSERWVPILAVFLLAGTITGGFVWRIRAIEKKRNEAEKQKDEVSNAYTLLENQIKERIQAEKKLRESETRYRKLVETSPDAISLCDIEGNFVMTNPRLPELLGYSTDEFIHKVKSIFEMLTQEGCSLARTNAKFTLETGVTSNAEYILIAKDGTEIPVDISTALIKDDQGRPKYFLEIARDIRKRKEVEREEKLKREQMVQIDKMVSLGTLVSGVKLEDLILGFMNGVDRIKNIISSLRNFSRPENGISKEPVEVNKAIEQSINLTNNMVKKATNHFSFKPANDLPMIEANSHKLEQVFINLTQNAVQALPDNSKGIYITTEYKRSSNQIVIVFKDEGEGISESDIKFITDPFYTTKRDKGGTGLGLPISMQIIQEHGGNITFESERGVGTTVTVILPVDKHRGGGG